MPLKRCTFVVNGEKIRVDAEKEEVTGPEPLMTTIREANERLKGNRSIGNGYLQWPPGKLWETNSLYPLLVHLFGEENVSYDETEPLERWSEEPDPPGMVR